MSLSLQRRVLVAVAAVLASMVLVAPEASAQPPTGGASCTLPESDADALYVLNAIYPNRYVFDHRPDGGGSGCSECHGRGTCRDSRRDRELVWGLAAML